MGSLRLPSGYNYGGELYYGEAGLELGAVDPFRGCGKIDPLPRIIINNINRSHFLANFLDSWTS